MLILLYPVMTNFRHLAWPSSNRSIPTESAFDKLKLFGQATKNYIGLGDSLYERELYSLRLKMSQSRNVGLIRRSGLIFTFSHVVNSSPEKIPFWKGKTYEPIFFNWIPRLIWPQKPEEKIGNMFGRRYLIIDQRDDPPDYHTSINLPWITEAFANYGYAGVIVGMALIGVFLSLLECFFNRPGASILQYSIGSNMLLPLFFQDSNFTLMTGSLLPLTVCMWIYFSIGLTFGKKLSL